jgi:hypothetical protein
MNTATLPETYPISALSALSDPRAVRCLRAIVAGHDTTSKLLLHFDMRGHEVGNRAHGPVLSALTILGRSGLVSTVGGRLVVDHRAIADLASFVSGLGRKPVVCVEAEAAR